MRRIDFQPAYILHTRPYQETSLILEIFTQNFGRFGVIAKGARRQKNPARALLQAFVPLLISCSGRGELMLLKNYEASTTVHQLAGRRLISAFYLNELLMRLLHRFDAHEELFLMYSLTLRHLEQHSTEQVILRQFEKTLLKTMGYELPLQKEYETGLSIDPDSFYHFDPSWGPTQVEHRNFGASKDGVYSGKSILTLANENFDEDWVDEKVLREIKHLMRSALKPHLGQKPLETRKLIC